MHALQSTHQRGEGAVKSIAGWSIALGVLVGIIFGIGSAMPAEFCA